MAVGGAIGGTKQRSGVAAEEAPDLPRVTWYKHAGLIRLYGVCCMLDIRKTDSSYSLSFCPRRLPRVLTAASCIQHFSGPAD